MPISLMPVMPCSHPSKSWSSQKANGGKHPPVHWREDQRMAAWVEFDAYLSDASDAFLVLVLIQF